MARVLPIGEDSVFPRVTTSGLSSELQDFRRPADRVNPTLNFRSLPLQFLFPVYDPDAQNWGWEARLLRWMTLIWVAIGLLTLFSASYVEAVRTTGDGLYYFKRQIVWTLIGLGFFNAIVRIPLKYLLARSRLVLLAVLILLVLTLIPGLGTTVNGATRWIEVGIVPIQPSEPMKPCLILQAAFIFGRWNRISPRDRITWFALAGAILTAILLQPNLSTTLMCGIILWLMAIAAGLSWSLLGMTAVGGGTLAALSLALQDYQRRRILSFLDPWDVADGDGYQLVQSLLAVASGGLWGQGFGLSQQKLYALPIQYSDFIFAVFAEEFGFVGCSLAIVFLTIYGGLAWWVAAAAPRLSHQLVAIGALVALVGQASVNIGVVTGALPTTGLPLPMFSYGGSSMVSSLAIAALLVRVARENRQAEVLEFDRAAN